MHPASPASIPLQRPLASLLPLGALLLSALQAPFLSAAAPATDPVGYQRTTLPAPRNEPATRRALGVPFERPVVFTGAAASVDATLHCLNASWSPAQFTAQPHFVRFRSGAGAGLTFLITAHSTDALTLDTAGAALASLCAAGNVFEIFPAHSLGSLFGSTASSVPLRAGTSETEADLVRLHDGTQWLTYYFDATHWRKTGSTLSQDNTVVAPGQGLFLICKGTQPVTLTFTGTVRPATDPAPAAALRDTLLSLHSPLATRLDALGLQNLPNWKTGPSASLADTARLWNGSSWNIYYHTGANWEAVGSFANQNTTPVPANGAVFLHRTAAPQPPQ